jgi:hypothetical protein|tara:strand:+ start:1753 stop:1890 length:138 start_codon:yes stop_codon:yes gene_type:complete
MEKEAELMGDPSALGSMLQILLIMNPTKTFYVSRLGDSVIVKDEE